MWGKVPVILQSHGMVQGQDLSTVTSAVPANGLGDPCVYWAGKNGWGNGWKLPTAGSAVPRGWYKEGDAPFGIGDYDWGSSNGE